MPMKDLTPIFINGKPIPFCIDSGSQANIITSTEYNKMKPKPLLAHSNHNLWPYGAVAPLRTLGTFQGSSSVTNDTDVLTFAFHVSLPARQRTLSSIKR